MNSKSDRYRNDLEIQLTFLRESCEKFDNGEKNEAIRIATHLCTLFHTTKKSTSLLKHLKKETISLLSTSEQKTKEKI